MAMIKICNDPLGLSSIQERPGRTELQTLGLPPSGPMDTRSFTTANRLVFNPDHTAAIEIAIGGLQLQFDEDLIFALAGAPMTATLNGHFVPFYNAIQAKAGDRLHIGHLVNNGMRAYLAFRGGIAAPKNLGSRATLVRNHIGSVLQKGDRYTINTIQEAPHQPSTPIPLTSHWMLRVRVGPQASPEYIDKKSLQTLLNTTWTVGHHIDRSRIQLSPRSALWPAECKSQVPDTPLQPGAICFANDHAVIAGIDEPTLGSFCNFCCIASSDLWKVGQLAPGNTLCFQVISGVAQLERLENKNYAANYLQCGDNAVLVEYGPPGNQLNLHMRVHKLRESLRSVPIPGIVSCTPGLRGLLIHYENIKKIRLLYKLQSREAQLNNSQVVPARRIRLPLTWDDPETQYATQCLTHEPVPELLEAEKQNILNSEFLIVGLGHSSPGSPLLINLSNEALPDLPLQIGTMPPDGALGLSGQTLCIYGAESTGDFQLIARTLPPWQPQTNNLLQRFDCITFYPVSSAQLDQLRHQLKIGTFELNALPTILTL